MTTGNGERESGTGKDSRKRLELCNWSEEVPVAIQRKGDHYSAKVRARGIVTEVEIANKMGIAPEAARRFLDVALQYVREGYDVEVCDAIHIYGCVKSLKTPFVAAKTMGSFRKGVADKAVRPTRDGKAVDAAEILAMNASRKKEVAHVTPDKMVACPKCGYDFRVGKTLG